MTPKEFFDKVVEMRRCQKEYFKNGSAGINKNEYVKIEMT